MGSHHCIKSLNYCDLVKVSELDQHLFLVQVLSQTGSAFLDNLMTKTQLKNCSKDLVKKKKVSKRVIKLWAAMEILIDSDSKSSFLNRISLARYVAGQSLEVIVLQAFQEDKLFLERNLIRQIISAGLKLNSGPKFYPDEYYNSLKLDESDSSVSDDVSRYDGTVSKDKNRYEQKIILKSISVIRRELPVPESSTNLGWPLLKRTTLGHSSSRKSKARSLSMIDWLMTLPTRSYTITRNQVDSDSDDTSLSFDSNAEDSARKETIIEESDDGSIIRKDEESVLIESKDSGSVYELTEEHTQLTSGWPLLRIKASDSFGESDLSNESVATSMMSQSNQSTQDTPKTQSEFSFKEEETPTENDFCDWEASREQTKKSKLVRKLKSSGCKQFSYEELERATNNFSSDNLIGEGGCSNVYKGCVRWGKLVAVKVLKMYKEVWTDFSLEVNIMSSLKHKRITQLIGVCIDDNHLILVYNFLSKGNLEDILQAHILPWKMRFKVAMAVAEALNYLHNECSRRIIHRDVKSSNILLADDFQPQLSDFGLATWGPGDSSYKIRSDIVGTFGYIAPEYFLHGTVSDKIDIYSFGIVLLELLTGKKPIGSESIKGQESLVKWAKPILESGNLEALVDPKLGDKYDASQLQRMVLAGTLCIKQSPILRPNASQILKLLRKEEEIDRWMDAYADDLKESPNEKLQDLSPELVHNQCSNSSSLVLDNNAALLGSADGALSHAKVKHRLKLKDYLKEQHN